MITSLKILSIRLGPESSFFVYLKSPHYLIKKILSKQKNMSLKKVVERPKPPKPITTVSKAAGYVS